jgi:hypothetical protein
MSSWYHASLLNWWESLFPGSASELVTAEELFPVIDHNIRRAPISVTFEELEDEVPESSMGARDEAGDTKQAQPSTVNQLLNENEQILYGPLYNSQALQGYILLCCQVPHIYDIKILSCILSFL